MFILKERKRFVQPSYQTNDDGSHKHCAVIDQFPSQVFNCGFNGLPANDITLLARATSAKEYEIILSRLREVSVTNPDTKGLSDHEIIERIIPEWVQTPSEIERFMDWWNTQHPAEPLFEPAVKPDKVDEASDSKVETE